MINFLHELNHTRIWNLGQSDLHSFRDMIEEHKANRTPIERKAYRGAFLLKSKNFDIREALFVTENPKRDIENPWYAFIDDEDQFINLVRVEGGIMRNNGCGSGSKLHRDQVIYAASKPNCGGHIFLIDTPGGSSFSKYDYMEAIKAAHDAGQKVIACIDGLCCSAGYALACQCDAIYYTTPNDQVGCIGTMAAYYTTENGTKDQDGNVYHEIYDPESTEKNLEWRKSAEGDDSMIIEELRKDGEAFRTLVKSCRPNVTDDQLKGKVFDASEVEGSLVDGRLNLQGCVDLLASQIVQTATIPNPGEPSPQLTTNMKKSYTNINAFLGETLEETEDGVFLNEAYAERINEALPLLAEKDAAIQSLKEQIDSLKGQLSERDTTIEGLNTKVSGLAEQNNTLQASVTERDTTIEGLNAKVSELTEQNNTLQTSVTERDTTIEGLKTQLSQAHDDIEILSHQAPAPQNPASATAHNGEGDGEKTKPADANASKDGMSIEERRAAHKARNKALGIR